MRRLTTTAYNAAAGRRVTTQTDTDLGPPRWWGRKVAGVRAFLWHRLVCLLTGATKPKFGGEEKTAFWAYAATGMD